jgi:hypothetical protein
MQYSLNRSGTLAHCSDTTYISIILSQSLQRDLTFFLVDLCFRQAPPWRRTARRAALSSLLLARFGCWLVGCMFALNVISTNVLFAGGTIAELVFPCFCMISPAGLFANILPQADSVPDLLTGDGKRLKLGCVLPQTLVTSTSVAHWFIRGASVCAISLLLLKRPGCGRTRR